MKVIIATVGLLGVLGATAAHAAPVTLDFNAIERGNYASGTSFAEEGFALVLTATNPTDSVSISSGGASFCFPECPQNGTNYALITGAIGGTVEVSAGGATFDLFAFDGAESFEDRESIWATEIEVTGTKADLTTVTVSFTLDFVQDGDGALNDFQTFVLPATFTDLIAVSFAGIGGADRSQFSVDNIVVATASIPEPAALAIFGMGLVGLGAVRRRLSA